MNNKTVEKEYEDMLSKACMLINRRFGTDFTPDKLIIRYFTSDNGVEKYNEIKELFPPETDYDNEIFQSEEYYNEIFARALISDDHDGLLIRTDLDFSEDEVIFSLTHELAHCFCTRNEIESGHFFEEYCLGEYSEENGYINVGYAIWRETIADVIAFEAFSHLM